MGGAAVGGNVTPAAEFNIYDDPDAAQIVFKSGVPLVMCGLDVTMQAELRPADWDEMAGYGNLCGSLVRELFACAWSAVQTVGLTGVAQHDSCPVLYLAHPELFEGKMAGVFVETQAELTLGKTVTDLQSDKKFEQKNALVLLKLSCSRTHFSSAANVMRLSCTLARMVPWWASAMLLAMERPMPKPPVAAVREASGR